MPSDSPRPHFRIRHATFLHEGRPVYLSAGGSVILTGAVAWQWNSFEDRAADWTTHEKAQAVIETLSPDGRNPFRWGISWEPMIEECPADWRARVVVEP